MTTIRPNRMVYADGKEKWCFLSVSGAGAICSTMALSWFQDHRDGGRVVVPPRLLRRRALEPDESVDHVEDRAQQVEEAVRQIRRRRNAEDPGDVGATRVPRHQDRRDRARVLDGTGQDLGRQT